MNEWYIGTIGYSYKDWVGEFYPVNSNQREYLPFYCKLFNSVEINSSFHAIPRPSTIQTWFNITPENFKFCIKTPQIITHELGLKRANSVVSEFLESVALLKNKLGPILIQLPPRYTQANILDLDEFLSNLPDKYQYAIEFRHPSWYNEQTSRLLSGYKVCWVAIDYPNLPKQIQLSSYFIYIRWLGVNGLYQHHSFERVEKTNELIYWIHQIKANLEKVKNIYGFFNNDYTGFAAGCCKRFMKLSGLMKDEQRFPIQDRFL